MTSGKAVVVVVRGGLLWLLWLFCFRAHLFVSNCLFLFLFGLVLQKRIVDSF